MKKLQQQIEFIKEIEKLKTIKRMNLTLDDERRENSAEHSWHVALMAVLLAGHANEPGLDVFKVVKILLIHDVVEIDAGDTWLYDIEANKDKFDNEELGADRIFGLLPFEQKHEFMSLWEEFEAQETQEALFARSLDLLQPIINHQLTGGKLVKAKGLTAKQVIENKEIMKQGSFKLWELAMELIADCKAKGIFK
jgi:putative hydrolase of HD superfamily